MTKNRSPINKGQGRYRYFTRPALHGPQNFGEPVFKKTSQNQIAGDIRLGFIKDSKLIFGISTNELVRHLIMCGSSGAGKSNALRVLQSELNRRGIPYLGIDTAKPGSRFLKPNMEDLLILRWNKEFFINPLQPPPGVSIKEWLLVFSEITTEVFGLRTASKLYLTEFVQILFEKYQTSEPTLFPTIHDLSRELDARLKSRIPINERGYINGIHSKIRAVCITLEEMIDVHEGIPIDELLKHPVCIELVGIKSSEIQYWIISILLAAIAAYREAGSMAFGSLRHVFFLDEAAHIVGKGDVGNESYVIGCVRRLREFGEGMVLADQCISTINDVVKSNVYTIIGMSQIGQKDRREMINVLGLNSEQAEMVNLLDVGQAIVRLGGRYPFPQLIKFPFVEPKNLPEHELDEINAGEKKVGDFLRKVKHANSYNKAKKNLPLRPPLPTPDKDDVPRNNQLTEQHKEILLDIYNRFDVPSIARAKDFGLSASASNKIYKDIEKEQVVDVVSLNLTGGRGKTSKYFILTNPKGYEAISKTPHKKSGGTGSTHFFLERYLKKHLPEKGFTRVEVEKNIGGKRIDVFGIYEGLKVGIEICVSTIKTEYVNVQKNEGKCDFLVIVTPDKKTKTRLDKELYKKIEPYLNMKTCVVHELLNHPEKIIAL